MILISNRWCRSWLHRLQQWAKHELIASYTSPDMTNVSNEQIYTKRDWEKQLTYVYHRKRKWNSCQISVWSKGSWFTEEIGLRKFVFWSTWNSKYVHEPVTCSRHKKPTFISRIIFGKTYRIQKHAHCSYWLHQLEIMVNLWSLLQESSL